jgi:hypothetical protein
MPSLGLNPATMSRDEMIRAIEVEANRRAPDSMEARFAIRNQLRAEYGLGTEKHKRGGAAGVWDRNKGPIGSIAGGLAASFIPGAGALLLPALGGIAGGAAARGKFDTSNILGDSLGGVSGGGIPKAAGALRGAFVPGGAAGGAGAAGSAGASAASAMPLDQVANASMVAKPMNPAMRALSGAGSFLQKNPEVAGLGLQAAGQMGAANATRDLQRQQLGMEQRQYDDERERKRRIGELLLPLWQQQSNAPTPGLPQLPRMGG